MLKDILHFLLIVAACSGLFAQNPTRKMPVTQVIAVPIDGDPGGSGSGGGSVPTAPSAPPNGFLDVVDLDTFQGWAQDPDAPNSPVTIHFYLDQPAGQPGAVYLGQTLANQYRPDVGYHGFTYSYPKSVVHDGARNSPRTIYAYAINIGSGVNPHLHNDGIFAPSVITLSNSTISVDVDVDIGGAIRAIWHQGVNVVDTGDTGRLIQSAFYDGQGPYNYPGDPNWGWNPVQAGNKNNTGSGVLDYYFLANNKLYVKTQPLNWNPDSNPFRSDVILEQIITLDDTQIYLDITVTNIGSANHSWGGHEMPCVYMKNEHVTHSAWYAGNAPWTNDAPVVSTIIVSDPNGGGWTQHWLPEHWVWMGNDMGYGLMLYQHEQYDTGYAKARMTGDGGPGYMYIDEEFDLPVGAIRTRRSVIKVGNWWDSRAWLNTYHF